MKRRSALLIAVPIALILVALLLVALLLDKNRVMELASDMIREKTGATLSVGGDIGLSLFPRIGVSLEDVSLVMPGGEQPALKVGALQLGVQVMPLLSGQVAIDRLDLTGLDYTVPAAPESDRVDTGKMSDSELDAFYAQRRRQRAEAGADSASGAVLAIPLALNVQTLRVTDSRLALQDAAGAEPTVIELRSLAANDLNLEGRPVSVAADIALPGDRQIDLHMEGSVRVDQVRQVLDVDAFELQATGATADAIALDARGQVDLNRQLADLQVSIALGNNRGEGRLAYAAFESPLIDADLHFDRFDPAIFALAGPEAATEADSAGGGDEPLPLAALRDIDTHAKLAIDEALLAGHKVQSLQLQLRAREGVIEIEPLTGNIYGGQLALRATFNGRHNVATLDTSGQLQGLDIAQALTGADTRVLATGQANLDWKLQGAGRTPNELVDALAGPITLQTRQVVLRGIGIQQMLCEAVALTNQETLSARFPADTDFQTLEANIRLADGSAKLQPLRAQLAHVTLTGTGSYRLLDGDFDTTFKARLSPELESVDRACRVSKRLTAIDWPVDCAGNIEEPPAGWCKVDTEEIIKDLSINEAQRKIEKKAGKLLEKLFN